MRTTFPLCALIVVLLAVLVPRDAVAQARTSLEGFGGLELNGSHTATPTPSVGGTVTVGIVPGIEIVGEAGRLGNVLPTLSSAAFDLAGVGLRASALYGEAGARFVLAPRSTVTPYAEATAGIARIHLRSDELGTRANAALTLALELVEGTTPTLGAGGGLLVRGGPILFDAGYRYKQLFANDLTRLALGFGQPLRAHQVRAGIGIRF